MAASELAAPTQSGRVEAGLPWTHSRHQCLGPDPHGRYPGLGVSIPGSWPTVRPFGQHGLRDDELATTRGYLAADDAMPQQLPKVQSHRVWALANRRSCGSAAGLYFETPTNGLGLANEVSQDLERSWADLRNQGITLRKELDFV